MYTRNVEYVEESKHLIRMLCCQIHLGAQCVKKMEKGHDGPEERLVVSSLQTFAVSALGEPNDTDPLGGNI